MLGSRNGDSRFYLYHHYTMHTFAYGYYWQFGEVAAADVRYRVRSKLSKGLQTITVSHQEKGTTVTDATESKSTGTDLDTGLPLYLFAMNQDGAPKYHTAIRLYSLKIWQDGKLVRNFRPVKLEGLAMLWDKVEKKLYRNKGRCQFVAGPETGEFSIPGLMLLIR